PNLIADTTANNVGAGDDVQAIAVGAPCTAGQAVVNSGPDGISTTQAEGPDLILSWVRKKVFRIPKGKPLVSKLIKFKVSNLEFGATAPVSRAYKLTATGSSCPGGTVTQIDADAVTPGLQASALVPIGGSIKGSLVVNLKLEDITTAVPR